MIKTEKEIEVEIAKLKQELHKARAITGDGVPIEIGMTVYYWDGFGLVVAVIPEDAEFGLQSILCVEPFILEPYERLFSNPEPAKEQALYQAKQHLDQCTHNLKVATERLKRLEKSIEETLNEQRRTDKSFE